MHAPIGEYFVFDAEPGRERARARRQRRQGEAVGRQGKDPRNVTLSSTMGPGMTIDTAHVFDVVKH